MSLKKLRKTANHLIFLRNVQRQIGTGFGGCRLILATGEKYVTGRDVVKQIEFCKKALKEGMGNDFRHIK